jgi:hypothetical protein
MVEPALFNQKQAMEYLNIKSYKTLYKMIDDGLEITHINGNRLISKNSIDKYIADHTNQKEQ